MTENNKRPVAHKIAIRLLRIDPQGHCDTLCAMYEPGTEVPLKDIPKLINAFRKAGNTPEMGNKRTSKVIRVLEKQQVKKEKEEKEKKREEKKES